MEKANETLQKLFEDEDARMLARSREMGLRMYRHDMAVSRKEGVAEGREEGRAQATVALRQAVLDVCVALAIGVGPARRAWLDRQPVDVLQPLPGLLVKAGRWPEDEIGADE